MLNEGSRLAPLLTSLTLVDCVIHQQIVARITVEEATQTYKKHMNLNYTLTQNNA